MTIQDITEYLNNKINENENKIVISFFDVRMKFNLKEYEANTFLQLCKTRLNNLNYIVYHTGQQYIYDNKNYVVETNELLVAIK